MDSKILTIIVTFNGMKWITKCIQSVLSSSIKSDIFIVDNASSDSTPDYIAKNFPQIHLVRSKKNLGFGAANNIGLQYAIDNNYDYVYLLNQDAWIKEDTLKKMISVQKENLEYGILSPMQLEENEQHFDYNFGSLISQWNKDTKVCEDFFFGRKNEVIPYPRIMAAHWLISRQCLIDVGGFSPAFFHYGEDDNYADRVWKNGYKMGIILNAIGIHDRETRVLSQEKKDLLDFCAKISDICGFKKTAKEVFLNYSYETLCKTFSTPKHFLCYIRNYLQLFINLSKYKKIKKTSLNRGAFLNIEGKS